MKLFYFVLIFFIKSYHARHLSGPGNSIRIPLTRIPLTMGKLNSAMMLGSYERNIKSGIPLENLKNVLYYGPVLFGTPPVEMNIDFDTGSDKLWVLSKFCNSSTCPTEDHARYDHTISKTYHEQKENPKNLTYVSGWAYGFWSRDTISIDDVMIQDQRFLEATNMAASDTNKPYDGIMGLGYDPENVSDNIVSKFCKQKGIDDSKFSFYFTNNALDTNGSELVLCGVDESKFRGELKYVTDIQLVGKPWTILIDKFSISYTDKPSTGPITFTFALVDTGTPAILGPPEHISAIYTAVNASEYLQVECKNVQEFPNITFTTGKGDYVITGKDYTINFGEEKCLVALLPKQHRSYHNWILGDVFLRKYYTVFDVQNEKIGFAESIHN